MTTIPSLTEQDIRTFVGEENFLKGQQYFHDGAIVDAARQGMTLKAYCYGSLPEPYRVQVTFDATSISRAACSCPVGISIFGNHGCKHVAALLLTCQEKPEAFTESDDLDTRLERRSKADLIALIKQMLPKQSEVEWQLTMPLLPNYKPSVSIDTEEYSHQVDEAFRHGGHEWDAVYGISHDLYDITAIATRFASQEDYANAAAIYEVVVLDTLGYYLSYRDEDGALGRVITDCVEGLGDCLNGEQESEAVRQKIIETIFAVYRFDVDQGGYGLTDDIPPELLQYTTLEEKRTIAKWVHAILSEIQGTDRSDEWHRKRYGGLLLALEEEVLSDEEFLRIGREMKRTYEVVNRLLEQGRVDEAIEDAKQVDGWDLVKLANLFVQHGQDSAVLHMMHERAKQTYRPLIPQWLKDYYMTRNNNAAALEIIELIFREQPRLADYQDMRELATPLGSWETMRSELLAFLETSKATYTLVEIALDEGDLDRALELLKVEKSPNQNQNDEWTYNYGLGYGIALKAAELAEEIQPHASIDIYQQHIEHLIAQRGRGSYQAACSYLAKIRTCYEKLGETEKWTDYIALVRKQNSRLYALKEELAAAGL